MEKTGIIPTDAQNFVEAWEAGESVQTVEMGGISDGYEMAIQCAAIGLLGEILKTDWAMKEIQEAKDGVKYSARMHEFADAKIHELDKLQDDGTYLLGGLSGAQAGAAKNLAFVIAARGYDAVYEVDPDRLIFMKKADPRGLCALAAE